MSQPAIAVPAYGALPPPLTDVELARRIAPLHDAFERPPVLLEDIVERALVEATSLRRAVRQGMALATVCADAHRLQHVLTAFVDDVVATTESAGPYARSITLRTEIIPTGKVIVEIADLRRMWTYPPEREAVSRADDGWEWLFRGQILSRASDATSGVTARAATHFSLGRVVWLDIPRP